MELENTLRLYPGQNLSPSYNEFILLQFPEIRNHRGLLAIPFCVIYIITVILNVVICYTVWWERQLHNPMCLLISAFLALNIIGANIVMPKAIQCLMGGHRISLSACLTQMFFNYSVIMIKCVAFLLMAFDRYIAICRPLHYHEIINMSSLLKLWIGGFARNSILLLPMMYLASQVQYCKSNIILNFACEYGNLLSLACGEVSKLQLFGLIVKTGITASDVTVLLVCYAKVLMSAFKITVGSTRYKAISTCGNHLVVALLVYLSTILSTVLYKVEVAISYDFQNLTYMIYFLFPAVVNPCIYGLRVKEIKDSLKKSWKTRFGIQG